MSVNSGWRTVSRGPPLSGTLPLHTRINSQNGRTMTDDRRFREVNDYAECWFFSAFDFHEAVTAMAWLRNDSAPRHEQNGATFPEQNMVSTT